MEDRSLNRSQRTKLKEQQDTKHSWKSDREAHLPFPVKCWKFRSDMWLLSTRHIASTPVWWNMGQNKRTQDITCYDERHKSESTRSGEKIKGGAWWLSSRRKDMKTVSKVQLLGSGAGEGGVSRPRGLLRQTARPSPDFHRAFDG